MSGSLTLIDLMLMYIVQCLNLIQSLNFTMNIWFGEAQTNDGNLIKFLSHYPRDWKPSFISDHEEDRCIVKSWRESIANENWLAPAKKEKLLTCWGLMVAKTNGFVPIVKWFLDCQNKWDIAKTCLEWTRNLMFAISLTDTLTILWTYLTSG